MRASRLAMLALLVISAAGADASGVWTLRLLTGSGESAARATVTLKQDGAKLTGTCAIDQIDQELAVRGEVEGDRLTWRCVGKDAFEASFTAAIDATGRQMTGEWATPAAAPGTFKGSRPPK